MMCFDFDRIGPEVILDIYATDSKASESEDDRLDMIRDSLVHLSPHVLVDNVG